MSVCIEEKVEGAGIPAPSFHTFGLHFGGGFFGRSLFDFQAQGEF